MIVMPERKTVYFDIDDTLVASSAESIFPDNSREVNFRNRRFLVHSKHCELMKDFKARGHIVVVWSAGGSEWAEQVILALKLQSYVDLIITKPDWYVDDKPSSDWLGEDRRTYLSPE